MTSPAPSPAKPAAPVAKFDLDGLPFTITFDIDQLAQIEDGMGQTCLELLGEFAGYFESGGEGEAAQAAYLKFSVAKVSKFVGICCSMRAKQIPLAELRPAFFALLVAFTAAARELNGLGEKPPVPEAVQNPSAAPGEPSAA